MEKRQIEDLLDELKMKPNFLGYHFWITAIEIYAEHKTKGMCGTYEEVAKKYNTTKSRVDRNLRHTYEDKKEMIQKYFNVSYKIDNSTLLALMTREIERRESEWNVFISRQDQKIIRNSCIARIKRKK